MYVDEKMRPFFGYNSVSKKLSKYHNIILNPIHNFGVSFRIVYNNHEVVKM